MKRSLTTVVAVLLMAGTLFAGGIVTNTNQSAMYTRLGNRAATVGIDAVYYNPAGLTKLNSGLHISLNNQIIGQTRTITSDYAPVLNYRSPLNQGEFIGEVSAPVFPGVYAAFKIGKWAFSAGFNPVGGGGGATYNSGLPSFEYPISDLPAALAGQGQDVTAYRLNAYFEGTSIFFGYQANVSYAITDKISLAVGGRYVTAKETYSGYLKDIQIQAEGAWTPVPDHFTTLATRATGAATAAAGGSSAVQGDVAGGAGLGDPLTNPIAIGTLQAFGVDPTGMNNGTAIGTLDAFNAGYTAAATESTIQAAATSVLLADQEVDAEKTGSGFTPIVSAHIQPIEMLNISLKYEFKTKLELTTASPAGKNGLIGLDGTGAPVYMFTDGAKDRMDMPALLAVGATLRPIKRLLIAGSFTSFFDKDAVWGTEDDNKTQYLSKNSWEIGLGAELGLSEKWLVSAGWLMTATGATSDYQSDLSYSLGSNGVNFGLAWDIIPILQLNLGGQFVTYSDDSRTFQHDFANSGAMVPISEKLQKSVWVAAIGLNISIAGKE